jgi:uncharacterized protein
MTILKSIIATLLFIIVVELIGTWILLEWHIDISVLTRHDWLINGLIETILVVFFLYKLYGTKGILPQQTSLNYYATAFLLGATYTFIQVPLLQIYDLTFNTSHPKHFAFDLSRILTSKAVCSIFLLPLSEELFFRHYIQKELQTKYKPFIAIGVASLLFASIHVPYLALFIERFEFNTVKAYITLFGGLISGIIYYKSKSIGPSILFHIMWNFMARLF